MHTPNSTVVVMTDDSSLCNRARQALLDLGIPEIHCYGHRDVSLAHHAAPDLIVLAVPRDHVQDLTAALDTLAHDPALAHLPVLVYVPEAEEAGLLEASVGGTTQVSPGRSSLNETDRSLDDGLPGGREDL
jgi:hypothetical protein